MTGQTIHQSDLRTFAQKLLEAAGSVEKEAAIVGRALVWADLVGRSSQGVWRLKELCPRLRKGLTCSPCEAQITYTRAGVAVVDGRDGSGRYLGQVAMEKAIELADSQGIGFVTVRNSGHFGAAAYYTDLAARADMLGFAFTNAPRRVAPFGASTAVFGTNPFAFGAPMRNGESVLVDFSTSAIAGSILRKDAELNQPVPDGVAVESGPATTGPVTLLPFGGAKGFCLALMVEILSGAVSGSAMSFEIPSMLELPDAPRPTGHAFLAIDIAALMPLEEYHARMEALVGAIKDAAHLPGVEEVLIPGETRWRNFKKQLREGVSLDSNTVESLASLAAESNLPLPW